jgi:hypothetical protein
MSDPQTDDTGLLLYGASAIATFLGLTVRQVIPEFLDQYARACARLLSSLCDNSL